MKVLLFIYDVGISSQNIFLSEDNSSHWHYQRIAMRKIAKIIKEKYGRKPKFFVFSDNIEYCKENLEDFKEIFNIVFVSSENLTSLQDFYLMTKRKHIIFPNSTFSWWTAFLIKHNDKIVITTSFNPIAVSHMTPYHLQGKFYHLSSWTVINVFSGEV